MKKIIIFDFDEVIEDNYELHYQLNTQKIKDLTREEHKKLFEGNIHEERAKLSNRNTGFEIQTPLNEARKNAKIKTDLKEILIQLAKRYSLGIITSAQEVEIIEYLKNNKIENLFSFVYGVETHKLKSEKFQKVMNRYKVKNEEIIFITDTLGDILEAKKLNIPTIAVDFGYHEKARLKKGHPLKIVSNFKELKEVINTLK